MFHLSLLFLDGHFETNPDITFLSISLPNFPVLQAQDMRNSAHASRSLATWPSQMQTHQANDITLDCGVRAHTHLPPSHHHHPLPPTTTHTLVTPVLPFSLPSQLLPLLPLHRRGEESGPCEHSDVGEKNVLCSVLDLLIIGCCFGDSGVQGVVFFPSTHGPHGTWQHVKTHTRTKTHTYMIQGHGPTVPRPPSPDIRMLDSRVSALITYQQQSCIRTVVEFITPRHVLRLSDTRTVGRYTLASACVAELTRQPPCHK